MKSIRYKCDYKGTWDSADEEEAIKNRGANIIDATCPYVKKIHSIVSGAAESGADIIIVGDPKASEVKE